MLSRKVSENADLREESERKRKRSQGNARKAVLRKERRLLSNVCETTKILTNGKREYKEFCVWEAGQDSNFAVSVKCTCHHQHVPQCQLIWK